VRRLKEYLGKSNTQLESSADEINKWKAEVNKNIKSKHRCKNTDTEKKKK